MGSFRQMGHLLLLLLLCSALNVAATSSLDVFNCSEPSSLCVNGACISRGIYSFCDCSSGFSGARCQYSTNCNDGNGRCDGACLPSGLCNCTNGLAGSHCNQLPTAPGLTFDPTSEQITPCAEGRRMIRGCPTQQLMLATIGFYSDQDDSTMCHKVPDGHYPVNSRT